VSPDTIRLPGLPGATVATRAVVAVTGTVRGKLESLRAGKPESRLQAFSDLRSFRSPRRLRRVAIILIWAGYGVVGLILAAGQLVVSSPRLNIGAVMGSVLLLGGAGVLAASALLGGSALGTFVLIARRPEGSIGLGLSVVTGWIGFAVLTWLLWGFFAN
jgi:hypothetical protein